MRSSYHKENLRQDLIDAGLAYVAEHGHASLSVRTLAQKVGVSPGAPYHHFPDRKTLLVAIAAEGFKQLIGRASAAARPDLRGAERLATLGMDFIAFTDGNPRVAELMYESELTPHHEPTLESFQELGQAYIRDAIRAELPEAAPLDVEIRGLAFWSAVFGFAALRRRQNVQWFEESELEPDEVARSVIARVVAMAVSPAPATMNRRRASDGRPQPHRKGMP